MKTFGIRLRELRREKRLTQEELAEILSISIRQLQRYEKDHADIPLSTAIFLADYFNVSLDYLVGRKDDRN